MPSISTLFRVTGSRNRPLCPGTSWSEACGKPTVVWTPRRDSYRRLAARLLPGVGTSSVMLDKTYGHMLPDALDRARTALDAFVRGLSGDDAEEARN